LARTFAGQSGQCGLLNDEEWAKKCQKDKERKMILKRFKKVFEMILK